MIKNTIISLSRSSKERIEALNFIKYTLLLNYETPIIENYKDPIPQIMKNCNKCCHGLFASNESSPNSEKFYFYFFGLPHVPENSTDTSKPEKQVASMQDALQLSFLDVFPPIDPPCPTMDQTGFPSMILDHCVLSCYHAVVTDLLQNSTVTSYECINNLKSSGIYSIFKLCKDEKSNFDLKDILKRIKKCGNKKAYSSSKASDFTKRVNSHLKLESFKDIGSLFVKDFSSANINTNRANNYFLQFSPLLSQICKIDAPKLRFFSSLVKEQNKFNILENFANYSEKVFCKFDKPIHDVLEISFSKTFGNPVDELYYRYLEERIFNTNLFYCLLRNIHRIESNTIFRLYQPEMLDTFSECLALPNVFSRQFFLQYAFDAMITKPISYLDFWHEHAFDISNNVLESSPKDGSDFKLAKWQKQFSLFCQYMTEYVIPIYEWCFTNMVMEAVEQKVKLETNTQSLSLDDIHTRCLIQAMNVLGEYMEKNYRKIISPISIPKYQDSLDIVTRHKSGIRDLVINADDLDYLLKKFFRDHYESALELNLSRSLNPSFFLNHDIKNKFKTERYIRNFYINLLYLI